MKRIRCSRLAVVLAVFASSLVSTAAAKEGQPNPAVTPAPRADAWWQQRHADMNARVKQGNVDLIFIGDSITQAWEGPGKDVWQKFYGKRKAVNLGISGDQTAQVLWRLDHGNIDGIAPKLAVIMIGTNNAGHDPHQPAEQVAAGIKAIVEKLRAKLPQTKLLLLAIFPRGADNNDPIRQINVKTNGIIAGLADGKNVFYLDIGPKFVNANGTLSTQVMPDLLHLSAKSYEMWSESIEPMVAKLMGEK
jgi:lysophospholipase L1-like esterase